MSKEEIKISYFPDRLFTESFIDYLNKRPRSTENMIDIIGHVKSVDSCVLKQEGKVEYLRVSLQDSRSNFRFYDFHKGLFNFSFKYESFHNIVDFDSTKFKLRFFSFTKPFGKIVKTPAHKWKVSHQMPFSNQLDYFKVIYERSVLEEKDVRKYEFKIGFPILGRRFSIFQEMITEINQEKDFQEIKYTNFKGKIDLDFTKYFKKYASWLNGSRLKLVHPLIWFDSDYKWSIRLNQYLKFKTNFIREGTVLLINTDWYGSNGALFTRHRMKGIKLDNEAFPSENKLNVHAYFNFKLKSEVKSVLDFNNFHWFVYASMFLYNFCPEKFAVGVGLEKQISKKSKAEIFFDYSRLQFSCSLSNNED